MVRPGTLPVDQMSPAPSGAYLGLLHQLRTVRRMLPDGNTAGALLTRDTHGGGQLLRAEAGESTIYELIPGYRVMMVGCPTIFFTSLFIISYADGKRKTVPALIIKGMSTMPLKTEKDKLASVEDALEAFLTHVLPVSRSYKAKWTTQTIGYCRRMSSRPWTTPTTTAATWTVTPYERKTRRAAEPCSCFAVTARSGRDSACGYTQAANYHLAPTR